MNKAKQTRFQMSESLLVGAILTIVGGYLDTYTYVSRSGVFANAQTGNIVFLGIKIAEGKWEEMLEYIFPILAFIIGINVALYIKNKWGDNPKIHWRQWTLAIEIIVLCVVAFVPSGIVDNLVNVSISFVCAIQVESFRKLQGNPMATTMCTGNLRSGSELLYYGMVEKNQSKLNAASIYFAIIILFIIGATAGVILTNYLGTFSSLIPAAWLLITMILMK